MRTLPVLLASLLLLLVGCTSPMATTRAEEEASMVASAGVIEPPPDAMPTVLPAKEPALTDTEEALPTETVVPSPSETPTSSPTPDPTARPAPQPTATPATPAPPRRPAIQLVGLGKEVVRGSPERAQIALTFDAGSGARSTPAILAALRRYGVHTTFFMTGRWAESFPELLKQIAADGHEFGNHSYSHPDFTELSAEEMASELGRTEALVQKATGKTTKPWFRPPFGARNQRVLDELGALGYRSVYWTLDSTDWSAEATGPSVLQRVTENAVNGAIFVCHADSAATAEVLPQIIEGLRAQGFKLVKLSELLAQGD